MGSKEIQVTCPTCASRLAVDVRTEKVLSCRRPEELDAAGRPKVDSADWDAALGKVTDRLGAGEDRFDASLQRERDRTRDLDELFENLKRKSEDDDEVGSGS